MAFDGIVAKSIVLELQKNIVTGKINKIFEPSKNEIILGIYSNGKNFALNICIDSSNCRINLTTKSKPNPLNAPNFCMLLRKHIIGYRIKSIDMFDLERIITIDLEGYNELNDLTSKKLIIELMGKHSNIILINEKNYIIDSLRHIDFSSNSYREILPLRQYEFPKCTKKSFVDLDDFNEFKHILENSNSSLENSIQNNFNGISQSFIKHILKKLSINTGEVSKISEKDLNKLYEYIKQIINNLGTNKTNYIEILNEKSSKDYVIDLIDSIDQEENDLKLNYFIDDFYYVKEQNQNFINYRNSILKIILNIFKKYTSRLININKKLIECDSKDKYKIYGEIITANLYKIDNTNLDKITLENYYDNNSMITIPLDKTISIHNNAKRYFKKYNKLKTALDIVKVQKRETENELKYIESIIYSLENSKDINDVNHIYDEISENILFKNSLKNNNEKNSISTKNKHKIKTKNSKISNSNNNAYITTPIEYTVNGYTVFVGKNNKQNDYIRTKLSNSNDIWFHVKDIQGSHVVLKTNEKEIDNYTLSKCAQIAAYYSKAKLSSNVPVDYCEIKYVKKPSGAKPGMVIYTNNKTLYVNPKI